MAKINTPSYDWLIPRDHRIKVIQNLCENTSRDLPREYQSQQSMDQLLDAMGTAMDGTWTKVWDETNGRYDFTFTPNYKSKYLTFVALESGTIKFTLFSWADTSYVETIAYSKNDGEWVETQNSDSREDDIVISINVVEGDTIRWKGIANHIGDDGDNGGMFTSTCRFNAQGNIMSLLYGDNFQHQTTIENECAFSYLFCDLNNGESCYIVDASNLILPATTLADYCYSGMFTGCQALTTAPVLSATTLADACYSGMFQGCTSLTTAPALPATILIKACYSGMFGSCTSLTTAPVLSATTLANSCYSDMFYNCTSLVMAPELPALQLAEYCYRDMFYDCTALTTAPQLPATMLAKCCYHSMFYGCTALNNITCLATDISAIQCTYNWVNDVAASGTFVKAASMSSWPISASGIPANWTVENYTES